MIEPIEVKPRRDGGEQKIYKFANGYGASVVNGPYAYGGNEGLFELAVVKWNGTESFRLSYETPITSDVEGYLTPEDVEGLLEKIAALPAMEVESGDGGGVQRES